MKLTLKTLFKVTGITLSLYVMCAFGVTMPFIQPDNLTFPYYKLGESDDHTKTLYIGATREYMPAKTPNGDVLIRSMIVQNVANNGEAKGEQYEYVALADCDAQLVKTIVVWHVPREGAKGESAFPNLTGVSLAQAIADAVNASPAQNIPPDTPLALLVGVACKFVAPPPAVSPEKLIVRDWKT
jgi:hypothetical protein